MTTKFKFLKALFFLSTLATAQEAVVEEASVQGAAASHAEHQRPSLLGGSANVFQNIQAMAALDLVSDVFTSVEQDRAFAVNVRSAELMFYSPIDQNFDGTLAFAGHTDGNGFVFELHEGYVSSSRFIPSSRFKVGKFLLGVGRLNQHHQHDWNFTTAPKVHQEFFADEAAADTGVEYTYLLPTEHFFEITAGVTSGYCYGHCHGNGKKPPRPLYYVHPVTYFELSPQSGIQLGLSYLTRRDDLQVETHLTGFDLVYKQRQGKRLRWLTQTEGYYQEQAGGASTSLKQVGAYHLTQYGINQNWFMGLRLDAFSELSKKFQTTGERRKDFDYAIVPIVTWKPSEFSTLRFSYTYDVDTTQGDSDKRNHLAQLQFNFILGAHPAHDF